MPITEHPSLNATTTNECITDSISTHSGWASQAEQATWTDDVSGIVSGSASLFEVADGTLPSLTNEVPRA